MGLFYVNTEDGRVATHLQLAEADATDELGRAVRPWHRIRGPRDASMMWYAVMRRCERGVYIGALCFRHSPQHASLLEAGWEEVPSDRVGP